MNANPQTNRRTRYRRRAIAADVVAEIDALGKSGRYPSRIAVLEAAFSALQREQTVQRSATRAPGLPPTVTRFAGKVNGKGQTATNKTVAVAMKNRSRRNQTSEVIP